MTGLSEHGFASLTPGLLARKGRARPAMRRQDAVNLGATSLSVAGARMEDLGWNDWGQNDAVQNDAVQNDRIELVGPSAELPASAPAPDVLRQIDELAQRLGRMTVQSRSAAVEGRRAAFTLRLDADRHFRLKMAGVLLNRSAQVLVTEALDKFLSEMPEIAMPVGGRS
ncbi:hypothetical protein EDF57_106139 [Novosphingobium sp. PhB55]|uniref:hypothetical protein n=1 Tax=Novosphingobium sp. PhB55 TaxID=2485106 RepID=UPI0010E85B91|nr:hypothetical protein [Novosphingobium sp. PhB55]TDW63182.1 hypothetical protein EDF57_106139 [Novosphingobium sp. PhB55]